MKSETSEVLDGRPEASLALRDELRTLCGWFRAMQELNLALECSGLSNFKKLPMRAMKC